MDTLLLQIIIRESAQSSWHVCQPPGETEKWIIFCFLLFYTRATVSDVHVSVTGWTKEEMGCGLVFIL